MGTNRSTGAPSLQHALDYARLGYRILPVVPRGRRPLIEAWQRLATADEATVRGWWQQWPQANIGILLTPDAPVMVLDVEGPDGHPVSGLDAWQRIGLNGEYPKQSSPSGGGHVFGRAPDEIPEFGRTLAAGIEIFGQRTRTKYVIAAPSVVDADPDRGKPSGVYEWTQALVDVGDLPAFPAEIFHGMTLPEPREEKPPRERDGFDAAVDSYNAERPLSLPRGSRRVECPVCGSKGCWGRLVDRDDRWVCFSETHKREFSGVGTRTKDGDGIFGDALDLDCHRLGKDRRTLLRESGHLKDLPTQIERYAGKPRDDAGDDEEPLARVWCHGHHDEPVGYVTPEEFAVACLDELPEDVLFRKDGAILTLNDDGDMATLDPAGMVNVLGRYVGLLDTVWRGDKGRIVVREWSKALAASPMARATLGHHLIQRLIECTQVPMPVETDDGRIRFLQPGYNAPGYYLTRKDPVEPITDAAEIARVLRSVGETYPFAAFPGEYDGNTVEASAANVVAHLLTLYVRPLIAGAVPMFVYMAPSPGTGKTSLAQSVTVAATGDEPSLGVIQPPGPKFTENVTAALAGAGTASYLWDNVDSEEQFKHPQLAALITGTKWTDRAKYDREDTDFRPITVWSMTVQTGTSIDNDLATRSVGIYLDANVESPQDRDFDCDPIDRATESHERVLSALMGAVMLWDQAGRPERPKGSGMTSRFGAWNRIVPGILHVVDESLGASVNANRDAFQKHSHVKDDPWSILTTVWMEVYGGCRMKTSMLWDKVVVGNDLDIGSAGGSPASLGRFLAKHEGRRVGTRKYTRTPGNGTMWHELRGM